MSRRDNKGRVLRKGESQRKDNLLYYYQYRDRAKKNHVIYAKDLPLLREREEQLKRDQLDGIESYIAGKVTLNEAFDRYITLKRDLRTTTKASYKYYYDHFVRKQIGNMMLGDIRYSDVKSFYMYMLEDLKVTVSSVENPVFYSRKAEIS